MSALLHRCSPSVVVLLHKCDRAGLARASCFGLRMFQLLGKTPAQNKYVSGGLSVLTKKDSKEICCYKVKEEEIVLDHSHK